MHFSSLHCALSVQFYAFWKPILSLTVSGSSYMSARVQVASGMIKQQLTNCWTPDIRTV